MNKNNALNGTFKKFNEDGSLQEVVTFADGEENGPFEEYYKNGKMKWKGYLSQWGSGVWFVGTILTVQGVLVKTMMCDSLRICRTTWLKEGYEDKE
jgi:hypothetical protein